MNRLLRLLHLRRDEVGIAFLLFAYLFLVLSANIVAKVASDTLFLSQYGSSAKQTLPYLYVAAAFFVGVYVWGYIRLARVVSYYYLILGTLIGAIIEVLVFYWMLGSFGRWVAIVVYVWVRCHSAIAPAQVWIIASDLFTTREARRVFGFMGAGGILGSIFGGFFSSLLTLFTSVSELLLSTTILMAASAAVVHLIWKGHGDRIAERRKERAGEDFEVPNPRQTLVLMARSRYLHWIAAIVALAAVVTTLIDYQFKIVVSERYQSAAELSGFFGSFYGVLGVVSFLLQILFTAQILKWWGLRISILMLPLGLFLGSAWVMVQTAVASAIFVKSVDGSFRHSVDRSSIELLYLPVSSLIKNQVKAFIDMVVWRVADGVAGLLLIGAVSVLNFQMSDISFISMLLIVGWIYCAVMARRDYHRTIRQSLEKRQITSSMIQPALSDPATQRMIEEALRSGEERRVLYALDVLEKTGVDACQMALKDLLDHPSELVAIKAMQLLQNCENFYPRLHELLENDRVNIRAHFLHLLNQVGTRQDKTLVRTFMNDARWKNVATVLAYLAIFRPSGQWYLTESRAEAIAADTSPESAEARAFLGRVIGALRQPGYKPALEALLQSDVDAIRKSALLGAGEAGFLEFGHYLVEALQPRHLRTTAVEALSLLGEEGIPFLADLLADSKQSEIARGGAAQALGLMPSDQAVNVLFDRLEQDNQWLEYRVVKAISKWRAAWPGKEMDLERIQAALEYQAREYYRLTTILYPLSEQEAGAGMRLLMRALRDRMRQRLARIFRVLGWEHPQLEIYYCYLGLVSSNAQRQANAIEHLESLLNISRKGLLMPIFEDPDLRSVSAAGQRLFEFKPLTADGAFKEAFAAPDSWIRSCAIFSAGQQGLRRLSNEIIANLKDSDPVVRETAIFSLKQLNIPLSFGS